MGCDVAKWRKRRQWEKRVTDPRQDAWSSGFANRGQVASHWWLATETIQSNAWWSWLDGGLLLSPGNPINPLEENIFYKYQNGTTFVWVTMTFDGFNAIQPNNGPGYTVELLLSFHIVEALTQTNSFWTSTSQFLIPTTNRAMSFSPVTGPTVAIPPVNPPEGFWIATPLDTCHQCST